MGRQQTRSFFLEVLVLQGSGIEKEGSSMINHMSAGHSWLIFCACLTLSSSQVSQNLARHVTQSMTRDPGPFVFAAMFSGKDLIKNLERTNHFSLLPPVRTEW